MSTVESAHSMVSVKTALEFSHRGGLDEKEKGKVEKHAQK